MLSDLVLRLCSMCMAVQENENELLSSDDEWEKGYIEGLMQFKNWILDTMIELAEKGADE